ncbi:bifunctional YncE family protein/alkaline phosphatase family protein [Paludisphaera mucosa]|uniref:Bifunctional YncE family protein/alkaline phosphatase family protein n=1 Tax=Paludisphaera mucosa TaxID=3030827 RepID=A0ABT6FDM4_9BACT|nr:bifunctional YncE family protein/alkaline phosphatase family protein [Paludisphaera mucosa]MDG3005676.1 bifunctional YncE family protein/alkaline phosphatase family protein [Paludisphaera mucosa]
MIWRKIGAVSVITSGVVSTSLFLARAQEPTAAKEAAPAPAPARYAGPTEKGFLLPNGWTLTPAGDHVELTDLPLNIIPLADGRHALAATSGFNTHNLSLIDLETRAVVAAETVRQSWFGLALEPKAGKVWWSGGGSGLLHTFDLNGDKLIRTSEPEPTPAPGQAKAKAKAKGEPAPPKHFRSGLALDPAGRTLYSLDVAAGTITATPVDAGDGRKPITAPAGARPYDVAFGRNGRQVYVSDWASRAVLALDPADLRVAARIPVGEHPNQIAAHPKDDRIFVANASSNSVSVIDALRGVVIETIVTSLFPLAPEGSTPDALAVAPDGETLFVANADNNCVAVIDVRVPARSQVKGFIPTGWYPTSLAVTPDGGRLLVGVGKGNQTRPNPPSEADRRRIEEIITKEKVDLPSDVVKELRKFPYIGTTLSGALTIVPVPDDAKLAEYTATVYRNCPYSDARLAGSPSDVKTAIPTKVGDPSPIKYVIYIIKENRTYDQVLGDMPRGNGDPALTLFGEQVTPNHHKLAREFVQLDNLYCNGHVSADGHPWSTMAYNTDYIARNWALTYSRRTGIDDDDDDLARAPSGYLWDACARAGLSYRSYGEYGKRVSTGEGRTKMEGRVPGLVGHVCPEYGLDPRDTQDAEVFLKEYREFEKNGTMPRFIVMSLGEDHTTGTTPGTFTPAACVASNDLALGRIVDAVSKSKLWPETAIFVIEDDAQNGPDHVDAHRTVGLVVSPYTKRGSLDSTQYGTVGMIRTMELILGLPPLSQFDAAATPMFSSFTDAADLTPYQHEPARIDLEARNTAVAYGAERSSKMDFSEYDKVDDFELNEILWHAVKGEDAPMPPAVRRAIAYRVGPRD